MHDDGSDAPLPSAGRRTRDMVRLLATAQASPDHASRRWRLRVASFQSLGSRQEPTNQLENVDKVMLMLNQAVRTLERPTRATASSRAARSRGTSSSLLAAALMACAALAVAVEVHAQVSPPNPPPSFPPQVGGQWGPVLEWPHVPVSMAHLPDGRILTFASNERNTFPNSVNDEFTYAAAR